MTYEEFGRLLISKLGLLKAQAFNLTNFNESLAEDLVQQTCERALKNWESFTPGTNFGAWLMTIQKNRRYSDAQRESRTVFMDSLDLEDRAEKVTPRVLEGIQARKELECLKLLTPSHRQALELIGDGHTYIEMANLLGVAQGTIKSRVARAREKMIKHVKTMYV
ncbi:MAG: polymerase sigma factor [Parcubacteria group bacterium]|nr:polymerase sigma factor [Parcubacteria group bacterium]